MLKLDIMVIFQNLSSLVTVVTGVPWILDILVFILNVNVATSWSKCVRTPSLYLSMLDDASQ